jgi:hypothetical protein
MILLLVFLSSLDTKASLGSWRVYRSHFLEVLDTELKGTAVNENTWYTLLANLHYDPVLQSIYWRNLSLTLGTS